ncbi:flagellar motor stator protein MotA [Viridibacillus sp. FSL R5-0477]|uniref:Chemotaxis protein motA n=1 Tax=Viridibacillus arenosi FSL R5-213 TaxID=1227360 RepID=W4F7E8_9BACL|nr:MULTISPECIES: flagellar motor stator protein MotA [Viridibacillus]ETT88765.1 chemotaxis protein motA [Viridibacillus arenosi FSL R5-213]OMC79120.1 flagellar motor protein MotA [Viridibacillus sp. FSL H8-0123]OMC83779.1 flagellar motor protein MotA [Viridibacillus sp. FSL H7-0596]OMC88299.1 flagellar motor protein MotA [Viridibacillus arenosi]
MDLSSIIGLIIAFVSLLAGMYFKGVTPDALLNPAAILIIIFGTIAAITIAFPKNELKRIPKLFGLIFKEQKLVSDVEIIKMFSQWADLARREGLLALESKVSEIDDPFLKNGLTLAIDGQNADYIRDVLNEEVEAMEDRHASGALIFSQAGTYAPTLGVLGAVIGLIAALRDLNDIEKLGHAISAAFVATLLGIFTGYVLWHPFANKLKRKSSQEIRQKTMMIEGILSVLEGEAPRVIEQKLASYLTKEDRSQIMDESGASGLGKEI